MSLKLNLFLLSSLEPSCRTRITKQLSKNYPTLSAAEEALGIDYLNEQPTSAGITSTPKCQSTPETSLSPAFASPPKQAMTRELEMRSLIFPVHFENLEAIRWSKCLHTYLS